MTEKEMQTLLEASEKRIGMMMDSKLGTVERRLENTLTAEMKEVNKKLDGLIFQMNSVYQWVDGIDLDVKKLKKAL